MYAFFSEVDMTKFLTVKKLAKTLLTSIIMSPITLSTAVITLSSVDNIVAMEDNKSIKTDVDLNNGIGKIVSDTINDNIKAKAKLLEEQKILDDENQYWAYDTAYSSSIDNLKKLFVLAKEHNEDGHNKFNKMSAEAIEALINKNGNEINSNNEASIFALLNGLTIYNSLYTIYNSDEYGKGTRSLDKNKLDLLYTNTIIDVYEKIDSYQTLENFIINKCKSENINSDENKNIFEGFLKHDWDCYLTQFGIINDIKNENEKDNVLTKSVVEKINNIKERSATKINSRVKGHLAREKIKNTQNRVNKLQQIQTNFNKKILLDAFDKIKNDNTKNSKGEKRFKQFAEIKPSALTSASDNFTKKNKRKKKPYNHDFIGTGQYKYINTSEYIEKLQRAGFAEYSHSFSQADVKEELECAMDLNINEKYLDLLDVNNWLKAAIDEWLTWRKKQYEEESNKHGAFDFCREDLDEKWGLADYTYTSITELADNGLYPEHYLDIITCICILSQENKDGFVSSTCLRNYELRELFQFCKKYYNQNIK